MDGAFMLKPIVAVLGVTSYAVMPNEMQDTLFGLRWMVLFIIVMILFDFYLGLSESVRIKKEHFRYSRAGRRTVCKFIEYMSYIMIGALLGKAILEPLGWGTYEEGGAIGSIFAAVFELDSIKGHVCALHNVSLNFSFKRFLVSLLKSKNEEIGNAVDEAIKEEKKDGKL